MILGWYYDMNEGFVFLIGFSEINFIEISKMSLNHSFSYMNINDSFLISESNNGVSILLILVSKIRNHIIFF